MYISSLHIPGEYEIDVRIVNLVDRLLEPTFGYQLNKTPEQDRHEEQMEL